MKRIAVIRCSGSGKSTLALKLANLLGLPLYHLDQYYWKPKWVRTDQAEYLSTHNSLCEKNEWIIDGMNLRNLDYRLAQADAIIFLDFPRYFCFWRIFKRCFKYYGKQNPSSASGCIEGINYRFFEFLKWVYNFKNVQRPKIYELLNKYSKSKIIYIVRSKNDLNLLIGNFKS